jgi:hypothetical protein
MSKSVNPCSIADAVGMLGSGSATANAFTDMPTICGAGRRRARHWKSTGPPDGIACPPLR